MTDVDDEWAALIAMCPDEVRWARSHVIQAMVLREMPRPARPLLRWLLGWPRTE